MKKVLIALVSLVALVLVAAYFSPHDLNVEREVTINKPKDVVFAYLRSLKNQDNWSIWALKDPKMTKEYQGTDGSVGFVSAWNGNSDVGAGEQEIKGIRDGARIDFELRFKKPFAATNAAYFITESVGANQTQVKWGFTGRCSFPMNIMGLFMSMEKMIGKDLQDGLTNLKVLLEK